jgi:protein-export membrane protein SecD
MKKFSWRGLVILIFVFGTAFFLAPLVVDGLPDWWANQKVNLGLDLKGGMQIILEVDTSKLNAANRAGAVDNNIEVIRNRIDQFGVAEPIIQKQGLDRIVIQLPGVKDFAAAENLVKKNALLEFKLVAAPEEAERILTQIDTAVESRLAAFPILAGLKAKDDTLKTAADSTATTSGVFRSLFTRGELDYEARYEDVNKVQALIVDTTFTNLVPAGYQVALQKIDQENPNEDRPFLILKSAVELTGTDVAKAKVDYYDANYDDPRKANKPYVSLDLRREGARKFERVTGENVQKRLAIVLDDVVYSAPMIQERIPGGQAQISGSFTTQEASELAILLNSRNLEARIAVESTSIVGATLGSDSIKSGIKAGIIGLIAVLLFMLIYYKLAGFISDIVLVFNIGFIIAVLTILGANLTLPGIAGIILTIGMAVDANVLIFERIREELDAGKTPRSAVDAGYKRAVVTIWDSNLTTLIAAVVLYYFGSGPIRGFAITLAIGIIGSMFCAIVFVRSIFDNFVITGTTKKMSI